jgi:hypothetical protein
VTIVPWMMVPGQERIVARRLKEVLEDAQRTARKRPVRSQAELAAGFDTDNPIDVWNPQRDGLAGL